ncbi:MAG: hypothetical protein A2091_13395 [Desulfuromonadales bacterium GWD2_61_12]|nr:MAG: hypothetical protein A2005_12000 [Desulfuromonadales bacterium GWC2_61_20]OGR35583.1 MAG: hypothetical protein A2091_13395 [Desulfuromonadales bacterium GWD2_61_12]HAD03327.1 hypothetical protein [Desulfuromonas sp.]HBT82777.1 hypothetical protein [Desulfuromonas sp.]
MTVEVDLFKGVLLVLAVVVVAVLVPLLRQLLRTLRLLETTLGETRQELLPLLRNLRESSERFNRATAGIESGVEQLQGVFAAVGEVRKGIQGLADSLQHGFGRNIGQALGLWFGLRTAKSDEHEPT